MASLNVLVMLTISMTASHLYRNLKNIIIKMLRLAMF